MPLGRAVGDKRLAGRGTDATVDARGGLTRMSESEDSEHGGRAITHWVVFAAPVIVFYS